MTATTLAWPSTVFEAPFLRGLDATAKAALAAAGRLREVEPGARVFAEQDPGDAFFVVIDGLVELHGLRRGDDAPSVVRVASRGDTFGEEASLGLQRRTTAVATGPTRLAEIPAALFRRGAGRSGAGDLWARELRSLQRTATRDLLRTVAVGRDLPDDDIDMVLDAARHEQLQRGERVFEVSEPARDAFLVVEGLVQLQSVDEEDRVQVQAYVTRGDIFGDEEAITSTPRSVAAVALGETRVLRIPAAVLRSVADRNPGLLPRVRRIATERRAAQARVVGEAAARTTRHVFHDLYRMQMARSLLVIDQDTCVRCGHCAWSCAHVHGASRLVRRGDKVVTRLAVVDDDAPRSLLVPNSCQHCKNPVCMIDCPTGAIGRDPGGEVFVRAELCTGCGNCAKACPWENIRIAPRPGGGYGLQKGSIAARHPEVAVKCDLCRDYEGPACVQACPTGSILRLDPSRDLAEVAEVLGDAIGPTTPGTRSRAKARTITARLAGGTAVAASVGLGLWGFALQSAGLWTPGGGYGLVAGWVALIAMVGLVGHAVPKRVLSLWMRRRRRTVGATTDETPSPTRSRVRAFVGLHVVLGWVALSAALAHAGPRLSTAAPGTLYATWLGVCGIGLFGVAAYKLLPPMLSRIERDGALPEDLAPRRGVLVDRLYRDLHGRSDLVKAITRRILLPYARAPFGWLRLLMSGRSLSAEQARLRRRVDAMLQGRGGSKLAGLDALVRTAVELRALLARRIATAMLRGWLVPHIVLTAVAVALLVVHVIAMGGRP